MKKLLLCAVAILFAVNAFSALVKDTAVYTSNSLYTFENIWIQSRNNPGCVWPTNGYGLSTGASRGMAGKDGKVLICRREAAGIGIEKFMNKSNILVYDGMTGDLLKTIPVPDSLFHQKDVVGDTLRAIGYPSNDIQVDNAGNVVLMSMVTNLGSTPFVVAALKIDLIAGTVTQAKRILKKSYPETSNGLSVVRFDAFNVFGDMFGTGYIMAAVAGQFVGLSNMVLRWEVVGGVANIDFKPITITKYIPSANKFNDIAPRVTPISETLFYLDGFASYPTIYDMDGNMVDSIPLSYRNGKGTACNGVDEFSISNTVNQITTQHNFVVYANTNTDGVPGTSWGVAELGVGQSLSTMNRLYVFPKGGMGSTSNTTRTSVPYINVVGSSAYIYVYGPSNGLAAYKLTLKNETAVAEHQMSTVTVSVVGDKIKISEEVTLVEVYTVAGQKVASAKNVSSLNAPVSKGVYIINVVDKSGAKKIQKVAIN